MMMRFVTALVATCLVACTPGLGPIPLKPNDATVWPLVVPDGGVVNDAEPTPDAEADGGTMFPDAETSPDVEDIMDAGQPDAAEVVRDAELPLPDVGPRDTGFPDANAPDAALRDAAAPDATVPVDAGPCGGFCGPGTVCNQATGMCERADAGFQPDASAPDAAPRDAAAAPDAGSMDTGFVDAGFQPDAAAPDAMAPVDAGPRVPNGYGTLPANTPSTINSSAGAMTVTFSHTLVFAPTEVTRAELRGVVGDNNPAAMISPIERAQYLNALSRANGFDVCYDDVTGALIGINRSCCRLPTEPEWRVLAQGPNEPGPLVGLNDTPTSLNGCQPQNVDQYIGQVAWYCPNSNGGVRQVRQKLPNGRGMYDVLGNVNEATEGCNWQFQPGMSVTNPAVQTAGCGTRTFMGGNWQGQGYQQTVYSGEVLARDYVADTSGFRPVCRMP